MNLATVLATLAGMTMANSPLAAQDRAGEEVVLDAGVKGDALEFRVRSGGCTSKAHFGVERVAKRPLTFRLLRLKSDYCEAFVPQGVQITFPLAEIGVSRPLSPAERRDIVIVNERVGGAKH